jgi:hypothetical protein
MSSARLWYALMGAKTVGAADLNVMTAIPFP